MSPLQQNTTNITVGYLCTYSLGFTVLHECELMAKKNEMFLHIKNHPNLGSKEIAELKENNNTKWEAYYSEMSKYWAATEEHAYPVSELLDKE